MIERHIITHLENNKKVNEVLERIHTRKIDRMVSKNNMKRRGLSKICKHSKSGNGHRIEVSQSYFAKNWREYAI